MQSLNDFSDSLKMYFKGMQRLSTTNIEYCSGFLEAMQTLNCEVTDVYAEYALEQLPIAVDLHSALHQYFEDYGKHRVKPSKDISGDEWHIKAKYLAELGEQSLYTACSQWFFASSTMAQAPKEYHYRHNAVVTFIEALKSALGTCSFYSVEISPPIWYAMEWENIVLESSNGRYLLHFSRSD